MDQNNDDSAQLDMKRRVCSTTVPLAAELTLSSVYCVRDLDHVDALYSREEDGFIYARDGHPNARRLAELLAEIEAAQAGLVVSSGMAASAVVALDLLRAGDTIVVSRELYGKTLDLLGNRLARLDVTARLVDTNDLDAVTSALTGQVKLLWTESVSNPLLRAAPIDDLAARTHSAGALLIVDSTFTPPPILQPLECGADVVIHSLTKFVSGHSDVTLGSIAGRSEFIEPMSQTASTFGFHASAMDCWLTERGLMTLKLRIEKACENARRLADHLRSRSDVQQVFYPGHSSHDGHDWLKTQAGSFGFMVTFELAGGRDAVNRMFRSLRHVPFCPSLGDVRTTVSHPATTSHRGLSPGDRARLGITDGLVRISVGIEPADEILSDFDQALAAR